jgi:alpha-1,2-glucosyltransferase
MLWLCALLYVVQKPHIVVDELAHMAQIRSFMHGTFALNPFLTTIPGYHLLMAAIMGALGLESDGCMRAISAIFSLLSGLGFYLIRRTLGDLHASSQAALFFFMPLIYPYYFLIYTDVLSLALVLCGILASLKQRHIAAAIILTLSILVRQNNVVWAAFAPALALWPTLEQSAWRPWRCWKSLLRTGWPYLLPVAIFLAYWAWNGTISLSKTVAAEHPDLSLHPGNVYFLLAMFLLFFPFETWQGIRQFFINIKARPWLILVPLLLVACIKLKGSPDNYQDTHYFLRNGIIEFVQHGWARWAFAVVVAVAACSIAHTRFLLPQGYLIYLFAAFYLSSSWLIENRYSIIPLALWMALRKADNPSAERWTFLDWVLAAHFFVWGIFSGKFML